MSENCKCQKPWYKQWWVYLLIFTCAFVCAGVVICVITYSNHFYDYRDFIIENWDELRKAKTLNKVKNIIIAKNPKMLDSMVGIYNLTRTKKGFCDRSAEWPRTEEVENFCFNQTPKVKVQKNE